MIRAFLETSIEWICAVGLFLRAVPHLVVIAVRQQRGRWYYLSDRPQWFIDVIADLPVELEDLLDPTLTALVFEARSERLRRLRQVAMKGSVSVVGAAEAAEVGGHEQ